MKSETQNLSHDCRLKFQNRTILTLVDVLGVALALLLPLRASAIDPPPLVESVVKDGSFALVNAGASAVIQVNERDWPGVIRAANDLRTDITRVTGITPMLTHDETAPGSRAIIIGTIGKSRLVDRLIREKRIDVGSVAGRWEATLVEVVKQPVPGLDSAVVIAGSDKRGTIYGIYNLSEQIGVSPWYWWADVPVRRQNPLLVSAGRYVLDRKSVV